MPRSIGSVLSEFLHMDRLRQDFPSQPPSRSSTLDTSHPTQTTNAPADAEHSPPQYTPSNKGDASTDGKGVPSAAQKTTGTGQLGIPKTLHGNVPLLLRSPAPSTLQELEQFGGEENGPHTHTHVNITQPQSLFSSPPAQPHRPSPRTSARTHSPRLKKATAVGTMKKKRRSQRNQRDSAEQGSAEAASRMYPCEVPECSKLFTRQDNMKRHVSKVHKREMEWKCPICGSDKTRKTNGLEHIKLGHAINESCPVCSSPVTKKQICDHLANDSPCRKRIVEECNKHPQAEREAFKALPILFRQ